MIDLESFRRELLETGGYRTSDANRAAKRAKPGWWTTLRFSLSVSRVFPMCAVYEPFGKLNTDSWAHMCFSTVQIAEKLGMNVILEGWRQRQDYQGPVVYLCNHMSTVETILMPPIILSYGPISFVAKASLGHLPFLEKAAEHMHMVTLGRVSPREDLLHIFDAGTKRITEGESFLIFPQGTRQDVFARSKFSSIGAKLAEKAGCPIVPIAVDTRCQPTRKTGLLKKVFKDFGPVDTSRDIRCACGPVIPCGKSRAMQDAAFDWMADKLEGWGLAVER